MNEEPVEELTAEIILSNAVSKHNIDLSSNSGIIQLIRYARFIGYAEGYKDRSDELRLKDVQ